MKNTFTITVHQKNLIITYPIVVVMIIILWSNTMLLLDIKYQRFKNFTVV